MEEGLKDDLWEQENTKTLISNTNSMHAAIGTCTYACVHVLWSSWQPLTSVPLELSQVTHTHDEQQYAVMEPLSDI